MGCQITTTEMLFIIGVVRTKNRYCLLAGNPYSTDKVGLNSMWNHGLSNSMGVAILFSEKN